MRFHTHCFMMRLSRLPQRLRRAPRGERLERLCNLGAADLLVPESLLLKSVGQQALLSRAEEVITLAKNFNVSLEVIIRQLQRFPQARATDLAVVLVSPSREGDQLIKAAFYDAWLLTQTRTPKRGSQYQAWLGGLWRVRRRVIKISGRLRRLLVPSSFVEFGLPAGPSY